jgi:hypothetical protein
VFTWFATTQENGEICEYQGQVVSFEWQSKQAVFNKVIPTPVPFGS